MADASGSQDQDDVREIPSFSERDFPNRGRNFQPIPSVTSSIAPLLAAKTPGLHRPHYFRYLYTKRSLITASVFLLGFSLQYGVDVLADLAPVSRASSLIYLVNLLKGLLLAVTHMLLLQLALWPLNCWKWRQTIIDANEVKPELSLSVPTYCHAHKALKQSPLANVPPVQNNTRFVLSLLLFPFLGMGISLLSEFLQGFFLNMLSVNVYNTEVMLAAAAVKGPLLTGSTTGLFYLINRRSHSGIDFSNLDENGEPLSSTTPPSGSPRSRASISASATSGK